MAKRNLMVLLALAMCLSCLAGCGASAKNPAGQPMVGQEDGDLPAEVIAALDEACEMEPFFCNTADVLLLWPETEDAMLSPLEAFIGGWGVVLSDGTVVLNQARCHATYDENGQPRSVDYESIDNDATVVVGLDLPEEWRGLTVTIIAPMAEGYPYYIGTGLPRIQKSDAPHSYDECGLWYWRDDRYVRVFEGVDHGETFSFEPAMVEVI